MAPRLHRYLTDTPRYLPLIWAALIVAVFLLSIWPAGAQSRIKDIASFEGIRDNQLVGYGLVVGLNGTGDDLDSAVFTRESLIGMLQRLGINARSDDLEVDNVAAVMVTSNMPPFSRQGSRVDVTVSALGDAESLHGGALLVTPLVGADGEIEDFILPAVCLVQEPLEAPREGLLIGHTATHGHGGAEDGDAAHAFRPVQRDLPFAKAMRIGGERGAFEVPPDTGAQSPRDRRVGGGGGEAGAEQPGGGEPERPGDAVQTEALEA